MYVVYENTIETNWQKTTPQSIEMFFEFTVIQKKFFPYFSNLRRSLLAVHLNDEIVIYVLFLKIVNFKLNCSFESVSIGEKLLI